MATRDFSKISSMQELLRRKERLQRGITMSEQRMQAEVSDIRSSLTIFTRFYDSARSIMSMTHDNVNWVMMGYKLFKQWRERWRNGKSSYGRDED